MLAKMESHPAQPAALFQGMPCERGPTCPYFRRRRCLFFHPEDEIASASLIGQDQPPDASTMERVARLERVVEQILDVTVLQITKDIAIGMQHIPQQRVQHYVVVSEDSLHRQADRCARGDTTTGPSGPDCAEDGGSPAGALRRQSSGWLQARLSERTQIAEAPTPQVTKAELKMVQAMLGLPPKERKNENERKREEERKRGSE